MADFGIDVGSYPDYDLLGTLVSGNAGLGQRVAKRLTNPRGAWFWAPNECTDLRQYLNDTLTIEKQSTIKNDVEREVQREEQVLSVTADVIISSPVSALGQTITIHIVGMTQDGPFKFVMNVTSVTLSIFQTG